MSYKFISNLDWILVLRPQVLKDKVCNIEVNLEDDIALWTWKGVQVGRPVVLRMLSLTPDRTKESVGKCEYAEAEQRITGRGSNLGRSDREYCYPSCYMGIPESERSRWDPSR
jgi:hypothetical protein